MLAELVAANRGKRGFTYTHKHASLENLVAIRAANRNGFTINLSANTLEEADALARKKAGPVVVILRAAAAYHHVEQTPEGRKVIICPESYRDDVQCVNCGLCADPKRTAIIGFPAHGLGIQESRARGARNQSEVNEPTIFAVCETPDRAHACRSRS